jgi:hypothetical protein
VEVHTLFVQLCGRECCCCSRSCGKSRRPSDHQAIRETNQAFGTNT